MKFGYVIFYVDDVDATIGFYERAFGLTRKMVQAGEYGELTTGDTTLAFAAAAHVKTLFSIPVYQAGPSNPAPPVEIGFVVADVQAAFDRAVAAGATAVASPGKKPWGQVVAYVRDSNGFLVEICTAVG